MIILTEDCDSDEGSLILEVQRMPPDPQVEPVEIMMMPVPDMEEFPVLNELIMEGNGIQQLAPRRTQRTTAGYHPNPHRLP